MKYAPLLLLFLLGCSSNDVVTRINISPPDWVKKRLISGCDKPESADMWMELTEHYRFKCASDGSRSCYGWYINAKAKCVQGGSIAIIEHKSIAFGNTSLRGEEE